jgi:hypothetical protein
MDKDLNAERGAREPGGDCADTGQTEHELPPDLYDRVSREPDDEDDAFYRGLDLPRFLAWTARQVGVWLRSKRGE